MNLALWGIIMKKSLQGRYDTKQSDFLDNHYNKLIDIHAIMFLSRCQSSQ